MNRFSIEGSEAQLGEEVTLKHAHSSRFAHYEVVRYLTRVRGTSVLVDTPLGIQLTRVSCTCSAFALPYV
jgi:hypothetical protein